MRWVTSAVLAVVALVAGPVFHAAPAAAEGGWVLAGKQAAQLGDPEADAVVKQLFAEGAMDRANRALRAWTSDDRGLPADAPQVLREFIDRHRQKPAWLNETKMRQASAFARENQLALSFAIGFGELFASLADPLLARSVWQAHGDLRTDPGMRLARTLGAFWAVGATGPRDRFVTTMMKLRLVHAAARHNVLARGHWNMARDGMPISQRLQVEELLLITTWTPDRLHNLGVNVSARDSDNFNHLGRYAGHLLGIPDRYLPRTPTQARKVLANVEAHYQAPSREGRAFAKMMLDRYAQKLVIPGARQVSASIVHLFTGPRVAKILDVHADPVTYTGVAVVLPLLFAADQQIQRLIPPLRIVHDQIAKFAGDLFLRYGNGWRDYDPQMPTGKVREEAFELCGEYGDGCTFPRAALPAA